MPSSQVRFVLTKRLVRCLEREEETDALSEQVVDTLVELFLRNSLGIFDIREKIRTGKTKNIDFLAPELTEREQELEKTLRLLYREYFNREVDACGFTSYFPQLCSGLLTPLELRKILETSDEYRQLLQQKNK